MEEQTAPQENTSGQPAPEEGRIVNMQPEQPEIPNGPGPEGKELVGPKPWIYNGAIPFRLILHFDGNWNIDFNPGLENEIAAVAMTKFIAEQNLTACQQRFELDKKPTKPEDKLTGDQHKRLKKAAKLYAEVQHSTKLLLEQLQGIYTMKVAAKQKEELQKSLQQSQPRTETSGTTEETSQTNEIHSHQESGGNSATSDTSSGSQHEEKRPD